MLNANTLGNSQFYTGGFAPEFGNALSGAFDLYLRNGSTKTNQHSIQLGALGLELASEGPFQKNGNSSYLFNYRYSTFRFIQNFVPLGASIPNYQDLSFKLNFPTKKFGTLSIFGLAGASADRHEAIPDSSLWANKNDSRSFTRNTFTGVIGMTHQQFVSSKAYVRSVIAFSYDKTLDKVDTLNPFNSYNHKFIEKTDFLDKALRISSFYNQKVNANESFRVGIVIQRLSYDLHYQYLIRDSGTWKSILDGSGSTMFYMAYMQWKSKLTEAEYGQPEYMPTIFL
jgi:hypothetical protein